jgi:hypothetical protein
MTEAGATRKDRNPHAAPHRQSSMLVKGENMKIRIYRNNGKPGGSDELLATFTYALHAARFADESQARMPEFQIVVKEGKREWRKGPFTGAHELKIQ